MKTTICINELVGQIDERGLLPPVTIVFFDVGFLFCLAVSGLKCRNDVAHDVDRQHFNQFTDIGNSRFMQSGAKLEEYRRMTPAERHRVTCDLIEVGWPYLNRNSPVIHETLRGGTISLLFALVV
jgi:hypothetical protein